MKILLSTLLLFIQAPATAPGPALERTCADDCMAVLAEAIEWVMEKEGLPDPRSTALQRTTVDTGLRTLVDLEPTDRRRAEGAVDEAEEVAALRQAAQRLELETVRRSEHAASQHCSVRPIPCECLSAYGTAVINAENVKFLTAEDAQVSVSVTYLGFPFNDGTLKQSYLLHIKRRGELWSVLPRETSL